MMNNSLLEGEPNGSLTGDPGCRVEQALIFLPPVQLALCLAYLAIFLVGVIGNLLVLVVVVCNKQMQTNTNMYIVNLSVADILMCCVSVPLTPLSTFMGRWVFGEALCKLLPASQGTSVYMSTFTLTAIALDRYRTIIHPFSPRPGLSRTLLIIAGLDCVAVIVTIPYSVWMELETNTLTNVTNCQEMWDGTSRLVYGSFTNVTQFVVPFATIIICYTRIMGRLAERSLGIPGTRTARQRQEEAARNTRTNRMLISMVVIFGISWFPINLINLVSDCIDLACWSMYYMTFFLCHVVAMSSTCYNPLLYGWFNSAFRTEFKKLLSCCSSSCSKSREEEELPLRRLGHLGDTPNRDTRDTLLASTPGDPRRESQPQS